MNKNKILEALKNSCAVLLIILVIGTLGYIAKKVYDVKNILSDSVIEQQVHSEDESYK